MIRFHRIANTPVHLQNPIYDDAYIVAKKGALGRSAGGQRYYYSKGITVYTIRLTWDELRQAEKDALQAFYDNVADGPRHKFNFKDHNDHWYRAWFNDEELEFSIVGDETLTGTKFQVDGAAGTKYPTTTRRRSIWAVTVELEVLATTTSTTG